MKKILLSLCFTFCFVQMSIAQISIADARQLPQGETGITIEGIVTNGDELGPIRYIQDDTGAIPFYDPPVGETMSRGDLVTVTGTMGEFNGLIQLSEISNSNIISSGNPMPAALPLSPNDLGFENEGQIAVIENVTFEDGGDVFTVGVWSFMDVNGDDAVIYVRANHPLLGTTVPLAAVNLTGIVSVFSGSYQILPRDQNDLEIASSLYVSSPIEQSDIQTTSFTVSFSSNVAATSSLRYGLTEEFELGDIPVTENGTVHSIMLEGLNPATFYYVQGYVSDGNGTSYSNTRVFSTQSESSGAMQVFFNKPVDNSVSTGTDAVYLTPAEYEGKIIEFIAGAQSTLDVAVYNNNRPTIVAALNEAKASGVIVRYIYDNGTFNEALQQGAADFEDLAGNPDGLMHNKFIVRDAESVNDSWVLSGSTNFSDTNIVDDANNMIWIQDQALARAYTWEFNEMWGGSGEQPSIFLTSFGSAKEANTPQQFIVGSSPVELYFSPSDNATQAIVNAMNSADSSLDFAILSFTQNDIGNAVKNAHDNPDVTVRGVMENIGDQSTEYDFLTSQGVNLLHHDLQNQIHHKYAIIDASDSSADPIVVTGSHNWSNGAENTNDENTLVVHNAEIANIYLQEFNNRWCELTDGNCVTGLQNDPSIRWKLYPIPAADQLNIELQEAGNWRATLFNTLGQIVSSETINGNQHQFDVSNIAKGTYLLQVQDEKRTISKTISIVR